MKRVKKISLWSIGVIATISLGVSIFFQNCGQAGFDAAEEGDDIGIDSQQSKYAGAPFAFDGTFDQISYMSCFGDGASGKEGFYTLMAGSYYGGGVRVKDEFISYARTQVKPIYPETQANIAQIKEYLSMTPANVNSAPQMSIRVRGDLYSVRANGGNAAPGVDYINLTMDLTDDRVMDPAIRNQGYSNYFPLAPQGLRRFEGRLAYNINDELAHQVRYDLSTASMLTLTFSRDMTTSLPRQPAADRTIAYGRGYLLNFSQAPAAYAFAPEAVLSGVTEVNLETNQAGGAWQCDPAFQFKIFKTSDRHHCPNDTAAAALDPAYKSIMAAVRQHLKAEYWDVSFTYRCAVPKVGECYPKIQGNDIPVAYDQPQPCYNKFGAYPDTNIPTPWCPLYVSFCFRQ